MSHELERISGYLSSGGLFNPELANHDAVRDLIIDCRDRIAELEAALREAYEVYAGSDGFIPETAAEGYLQQLISEMVAIIGAELKK